MASKRSNYWREYRRNNAEKIRKRQREWARERRKVLPERSREAWQKWRATNRDHLSRQNSEWGKRNPEKRKEIYRRYGRKQSRELSDQYVLSTITSKTTLRRKDIPQSMIEAKRAQLMLLRKAKA